MIKNSIRVRLSLAFIGLAIIPLMLAGVLMLWRTYIVEEQQAIALQDEIARRVSDTVESYIFERETELRMLDRVAGLTFRSMEQQRVILRNLLAYQRAFDELALLDSSGQELVRVAQTEVITQDSLQSRAEVPGFVQAKSTGQTYYGPVVYDQSLNHLVMTIALPLKDLTSGEIDFVLVGTLRLQFVEETLDKVTDAETVYILNRDHQVIAHPNLSVVLRGTFFDLPDDEGVNAGLSGNNVLLAYEPIDVGDLVLTVVVEQSEAEAMGLVLNNAYLLAGILFTSLVVAMALVVSAIRIIIRPLENLALTARSIQDGDLSVQATVSSQDEIGELASVFNSMTSRLRDTVVDLEKRVADRTRDLELAVDVSRRITANLQPENLLNEVVTETRRTFQLYAMHIYLLNDEGDKLLLKASAFENGNNEQRLHEIPIDGEQSLLIRCIQSREIVALYNIGPDARHVGQLPATRSELVVPLIRGDRLLGVMDIQSDKPDSFTANDERVMTVIARQLAVALENAELFAEQVQVAEGLRQVDLLKSQFLANMSHELRTPLNAVINFTQFVIDGIFGEVNEAQIDALQKVFVSGKHLLSLINDILDFSKIEAGMLQIYPKDVHIDQLMQDIRDTSAGIPLAEEVSLRYDIADDIVSVMQGDGRRIHQILLNLLSNAARFTRQGNIVFKAWSDEHTIFFSVSDTGIGLSPEDAELIFQPFQQGTGAQGFGTGLGLSISCHLAQAHGGRLWVESELGSGSTFYLSLPIDVSLTAG